MTDDSDPRTLIDVWDLATFDAGLRLFLERNSELISSYWRESRRLFDEREAQTRRGPPEENMYGRAYIALKDQAAELMRSRTIRAWHFTRLTPRDVEQIRGSGMQPMTLEGIRARLDHAVEDGHLDAAIADELYVASPYHDQIDGNRELRVWLTAQPYTADDGGVRDLLGKWGGESVYFNHYETPMEALLRTIGDPWVIEVALPVAVTTRADCAGENVIDAWSFTLGCRGGWGGGCDIVAVEPIEPEWIIAMHRLGDGTFEPIADDYVERFGE